MNRKFLLFSLLVASSFTMHASDQPGKFLLSGLVTLARSFMWQPAAPAQPAAAAEAARAGEQEAVGDQPLDFNPETIRLRFFNIEEILSELDKVKTLQGGKVLKGQFQLRRGILFLKYVSENKKRVRAWKIEPDDRGIVSS